MGGAFKRLQEWMGGLQRSRRSPRRNGSDYAGECDRRYLWLQRSRRSPRRNGGWGVAQDARPLQLASTEPPLAAAEWLPALLLALDDQTRFNGAAARRGG